MVKSGLFLTLLLGIAKSLNGHQIIQFTHDGDNYALPLLCNEENPVEASFLLNLHSRNTVLAGPSKCFSYSSYSDLGISLTSAQDSEELDVDTAFASYSGHKGSISCKIAGKGMDSTRFNVVVPKTCSPSDLTSEETKGQAGLLGLAPGLNEDSFTSKFKTFGIHIPNPTDPEQQGNRGMFIYDINFNSDYYEDGKPLVVPANMDFQMEFVNELYFGKDKEILSVERDEVKVGFDLNYPYIGLPELVYDKVLALFKIKGLDCPLDKEAPVCTYSGDVTSLPELGIGFAYGTNLLIGVEAKQYLDMKAYKETKEIKLRIRKLDSINEGYESTIVLGRAFMEHRYVTFDYKDLMHVKIRIYGENPHMKYDAKVHDTKVQTQNEPQVASGYEIKENHGFRPPNLHPEPKIEKKDENGTDYGYYLLAGVIGTGLLAALVVAFLNRRKEEVPSGDIQYYHELVSTPVIDEPLKAI